MHSIKRTYEIREIIEESPQTKSFFFDFPGEVVPGQFFMIWIPGVDEIPISVSYSNGKRIGMSVYEVGEATAAMNKKKVGEFVGVRGPYGKGFELKGKNICVISGGCGSAPLIYLAELAKSRGINVTAIVGARTKEQLLFLDRFGKCGKVLTATDDGSGGHTGFVTEVLEKEIGNFDYVYTCGPEIMMKNALDICVKNTVPMQASLERYMKCGMGICGSCMIDGLRVCADGPVFDDKVISKLKEFGKVKREPSGKSCYL